MRILVAGATGAVGSKLLPLLASAGHTVFGITRTPAKAQLIRSLGAEPVVANGLHGVEIDAAFAAAKPEVVVHEMTDLKDAIDLRHFDRAFAASNRLRTEGTDHLLTAARRAGVRRFVAQSYCGWPYAREGGPVKTETDPLDPDPPAEFLGALAAICYLEDAVTRSAQPEGIVLRYGGFYGDDTGVFAPYMVEQIRRRRVPLIGDGNGYWSFVHVEDAAQATVLAIERGQGSAIYNIVDDDPAPVHAWLPALATVLGARPPFHVPAWVARIIAGEHMVVMMTQLRAGSNAKAKRELGWQPAHASWRQGFAGIAARELRRKAAA